MRRALYTHGYIIPKRLSYTKFVRYILLLIWDLRAIIPVENYLKAVQKAYSIGEINQYE